MEADVFSWICRWQPSSHADKVKIKGARKLGFLFYSFLFRGGQLEEDKGPSSGAHLASPCSISMQYFLIHVCKGMLVSQCWVLCFMDGSLCSTFLLSFWARSLFLARPRGRGEAAEGKNGCSEWWAGVRKKKTHLTDYPFIFFWSPLLALGARWESEIKKRDGWWTVCGLHIMLRERRWEEEHARCMKRRGLQGARKR